MAGRLTSGHAGKEASTADDLRSSGVKELCEIFTQAPRIKSGLARLRGHAKWFQHVSDHEWHCTWRDLIPVVEVRLLFCAVRCGYMGWLCTGTKAAAGKAPLEAAVAGGRGPPQLWCPQRLDTIKLLSIETQIEAKHTALCTRKTKKVPVYTF